jgi:UDP-glucose 4-epimerase
MNTNQTALVTGATGAIGPVLVRQLLNRGWNVRVLTRNSPPAGLLARDVASIRGDITDPRALRKATAGADVVFHLAAKLHINDPSPQLAAEYRRVNVEGTANVAEVARQAGVRRLVVFSTINVYGCSHPDELLDEQSPLCADAYYATSKIEAERIALATLPAVVLRLAAVYGPGMKGNYPRLLRALQKGRFAFVGRGNNRRTLVHVEDVCAASLLAAEHPRAVGQIYNVTDGTVHTLREIVAAMCLALNRWFPRLCLPAAPVRMAAAILDDAARLILRKHFPARAAVQKILEDIAVRGQKIRDELAFRPQYDLVRGWQQTVALHGALRDVGVPPPHFLRLRLPSAGDHRETASALRT